MIKYIFFDCDDTLLDFHWAEQRAIARTLEQMGIQATPAVISRYSAINQHMWELLEAGEITRPELLTRRFRTLYEELGVDRSPEETQEYYEEFLSQGHCFMEGALELLQALKGKYKLYMVSNGTAKVQSGRLKSAGIAPYFEEIFISETIGINKPEKAFFDHCFSHIPGFSPSKAMIVGDSLSSDMQGGNNAGILTCWMNPRKKPRRPGIHVDYEIRTLSEIPGILEAIQIDSKR